MNSNTRKVGVISDTDRRLMERVRDLVVQGKVAEGLLQAHFAAEYGLSASRSILGDGTILENVSESNAPGIVE